MEIKAFIFDYVPEFVKYLIRLHTLYLTPIGHQCISKLAACPITILLQLSCHFGFINNITVYYYLPPQKTHIVPKLQPAGSLYFREYQQHHWISLSPFFLSTYPLWSLPAISSFYSQTPSVVAQGRRVACTMFFKALSILQVQNPVQGNNQSRHCFENSPQPWKQDRRL